MNRFLLAALIVFFALMLYGGERRTTYYPGHCPDGQSWYMVDSDSDSITVGCMDPDYQADDTDPD